MGSHLLQWPFMMQARCALLVALIAPALVYKLASAQTHSLPPQRRQPTPMKVVDEHLAAFNACDWDRLLAGFAENAEFFAPDGSTTRGREALGKMYEQVVKPPSQGGTCGLKVTPEHVFVVGETVNVQWRADAPFLAEPYRGADAYETHDGLMAAQVTTFEATALKMKAKPAKK